MKKLKKVCIRNSSEKNVTKQSMFNILVSHLITIVLSPFIFADGDSAREINSPDNRNPATEQGNRVEKEEQRSVSRNRIINHLLRMNHN